MFQQVLKDAMLAAHPVGSIYESTDSTSPEVLFGGTWETMESGRVLVSSGTASTGTVYNAGDKGGEEAHKLSESENAPHSHSASCSTAGAHSHYFWANRGWDGHANVGLSNGWDQQDHKQTETAGAHSHVITIGQSGQGAPHNNMMPYEVIYRWKRTA